MSNKKILVIGGTGYLGQHLLQALIQLPTTNPFHLAFTHHSSLPPPLQTLLNTPNLSSFQIDLRTGEGFEAISHTFGQVDVVVNCAAMSVPRACEMDVGGAFGINVPRELVKWMKGFCPGAVLIHLSTDQVYEGVKSFYTEEDETLAVNVYGKSKVAAEEYITANCMNFVILRSSIIYGPQTISPVAKSLPIQWIDKVLADGENVDFFHDEFRCPVYVMDVVTIILGLSKSWISDSKPMQLLLNMGGPDRVSRVQMAEAVASLRGYNTSLIKHVSASTVERGVKSPADISMNINKLIQTLAFTPTSFLYGVRLTLEAEDSS